MKKLKGGVVVELQKRSWEKDAPAPKMSTPDTGDQDTKFLTGVLDGSTRYLLEHGSSLKNELRPVTTMFLRFSGFAEKLVDSQTYLQHAQNITSILLEAESQFELCFRYVRLLLCRNTAQAVEHG